VILPQGGRDRARPERSSTYVAQCMALSINQSHALLLSDSFMSRRARTSDPACALQQGDTYCRKIPKGLQGTSFASHANNHRLGRLISAQR